MNITHPFHMSNPIPIALLILQGYLKGNEPTIGKESASTYPAEPSQSASFNPSNLQPSLSPNNSSSKDSSSRTSLSPKPTLTLEGRPRPCSVRSTSRPRTGSLGGSWPTPLR